MIAIDTESMKRRRLELGLSIAELASRAGYDVRTIQRLEKGTHLPRLGTVRDIAEVLKLEIPALTAMDPESPDSREPDDPVVTAFKAADDAIEAALSRGGTWGVNEITAVLSLLLTRYGSGIARETDLETGVFVIDAASEGAKKSLSRFL